MTPSKAQNAKLDIVFNLKSISRNECEFELWISLCVSSINCLSVCVFMIMTTANALLSVDLHRITSHWLKPFQAFFLFVRTKRAIEAKKRWIRNVFAAKNYFFICLCLQMTGMIAILKTSKCIQNLNCIQSKIFLKLFL